MSVYRFAVRCLLIAWAAPGSALGLGIGLVALLAGGRGRIHSGVLEFHGPAIVWFLKRVPFGPASAVTFGHVVLGQTPQTLELSRRHERIHVRQYERWGPFFIPAYLSCSALLWLRGKDAYRENPFEIEAFDKA
jgi:hypothetical protein